MYNTFLLLRDTPFHLTTPCPIRTIQKSCHVQPVTLFVPNQAVPRRLIWQHRHIPGKCVWSPRPRGPGAGAPTWRAFLSFLPASPKLCLGSLFPSGASEGRLAASVSPPWTGVYTIVSASQTPCWSIAEHVPVNLGCPAYEFQGHLKGDKCTLPGIESNVPLSLEHFTVFTAVVSVFPLCWWCSC